MFNMFNKIFGKRKTQEISALPILTETEGDSPKMFQERPRICLIDIDTDAKDALVSDGLLCVAGSLGSLTELPNQKHYDKCYCRLDYDIPQNLHEYDIIVIDLKNREPIQYDSSCHNFLGGTSTEKLLLLCEFPQTIFDPRPLVGHIQNEAIEEIQKKESIIIVFASSKEEIIYNSVTLTSEGYEMKGQFKCDSYSFLPNIPKTKNKTGIETKVVVTDFLKNYNTDFFYEITFEHPEIRDKARQKYVKDPDFLPLITNSADEIISYAQRVNSSILCVFPQLKDKTSFLHEVFQKFLPAITPKLFPFNTQFLWLKNQEYKLPNEEKLYSEKQLLKKEFAKKIKAKEYEIDENRQEYQFLHDLLTETDMKLVKSVASFLHWLGFGNVVNCDEVNPDQKEEDLQVSLDDGLLVVEVKGIGGTSKDSECLQINKIKHRREKERSSFDVFALYIVNHQRYLPPENRSNPPFTDQQINDADNDERGLLTTYDLFKLYYTIDAGFISKDDARKSLLNFGLVTFSPSNSISIGKPLEICYNNTVGIFQLENMPIQRGEDLIIYSDGRYCKVKVVSLQDQGKDIEEASNGEIGIKISGKFSKESELWKPKTMIK